MNAKSALITVAFCFALPGVIAEAKASVCDPVLAPRASGPQVSDTQFSPSVSKPAYPAGSGPFVYLDEAHHNFHTVEGRYATFADLLRKDGFVVSPLREEFSAKALADADILVIANALAAENADPETGWKLPVPSAFTDREISAIEQWVSAGGSLFLIADHMPWPGAETRFTHGLDPKRR